MHDSVRSVTPTAMSVVSQNGTANCAEFLDGSAARSPTAIARRPSHRAVQINRAAWCAIVLLVIAQGILFRHHAMREIVWAYPPDHDQLTYLEESYQTYEEFLHRGIGGLAEGLGLRAGPVRLSPSSATLNLQAALIYSAAGPSRLSAISLNFFYWALFQLTFVGTVRWLTKRWSAAFLALALLLTTRSAFQLPGGLFDFRLDFIASCLFGIVICVVIRSRCFALWRWSLVAGCAAAMLATFRFITVVYLFGAFAVYLAILLLQLWRRQHDVAGRRAVARQMKGLLAGAAIFAAVTGPVLWQRREAITYYYVRGHVIGHDKELRALVAGNTTWERSLSFYPRSLLHDHLGAAFALLNSVVLALSLSLAAFAVVRPTSAQARWTRRAKLARSRRSWPRASWSPWSCFPSTWTSRTSWGTSWCLASFGQSWSSRRLSCERTMARPTVNRAAFWQCSPRRQ